MGTRSAARLGFATIAACVTIVTVAPGISESSSRSTQTSAEPASGGTLTYLHAGQGIDDAPFEPASLSNETDTLATYLNAVFGMLVYEDYDAHEVVPWMAESLTATDASNWVLTLREDMTFTDGTSFDAEAVKYNWERAKSGEGDARVAGIASQIKTLTVSNPLTLEIELVSPNSAFDHTVARNLTLIGSPTALQADPAAFVQGEPVGAGPFVLTSFSADGTMELAPNADYWDAPRPYLDRLVIRHVADDQQRLNTFVSGDAELMLASPTLDVSSAADAAIISTGTPAGGGGLIFNTARAPFNDENARRAVQHAIDPGLVNDTVLGGRGREMTGMFFEDSPFYDPDATFPEFDRERAQQLFDDYAEQNGGPMELQFAAVQQPGGPGFPELFKSMLEEYDNVSVTLTLSAGPEYFPSLLNGAFDAAVFPWGADHPLSDFLDFYSSEGPLNLGKYSNPEVDRLLGEAAATTDEAEQIDLFKDVQQILVTDDAVAYFLFQVPSRGVATSDVQGLEYAADGIWLWDRVWLSS